MSPAGIDSMKQEQSNVMEIDLKYQEDCEDLALAQYPSFTFLNDFPFVK